MTGPQRRLADRLLDDSHMEAGREVAVQFAERDRFDPATPTLSTMVAATIAEAEERGREEVRALARRHAEQRRRLAATATAEAAGYLSRGQLGHGTNASAVAAGHSLVAEVLDRVAAGEEPA